MTTSRVFALICIIALTASLVSATGGRVEIAVRDSEGYTVAVESSSWVSCSDAGSFPLELRYGSYAHCRNRCLNYPNRADGTWQWHAYMPSFSCAGPDPGGFVPYEVPGSGAEVVQTLFFCPRSGSGACSATPVDYCDCYAPTGASITARPNTWYRGGFTASATFTDNHDAYQLQSRNRNTGSPSWSGWSSWITCTDRSTCTENVPVVVSGSYCTATGTNRCQVQVAVRDYWHNDATATQTFNIDRIAPTSTHEILGIPDHTDSEGSWYRSEVSIRVDSRDNVSTSDQSGLKTIFIERRYEFSTTQCSARGNIAYTPYGVSGLHDSATRTDSTLGVEEVRFCYYAEDQAVTGASAIGNREPVRTTSARVWIDGEPPTTSIEPTPTEWTRDNSVEWTVRCDDGVGSGCDRTYYRSNARTDITSCPATYTNNWTHPLDERTLSETACPAGDTCLFTFCAYSVDNVGNEGDEVSVLYGVDQTPPRVDPFVYIPGPKSPGNPAGSTLSGATDTWFNDDFSVNLTFRDDGSGVHGCDYRINGGAWQTAGCSGEGILLEGTDGDRIQTRTIDVPVGPSASGPAGACTSEGRDACTIEVRAVDGVGNEMQYSESETVSIDWTPPQCELNWVYQGDGSINQHYNDTLKTFYYNNNDSYNPQEGTYTVEVLFWDETATHNGNDVSGIMITEFPELTGRENDGDNYIEVLDMFPGLSTNFPVYLRNFTYDYDAGSVYTTLNNPPARVVVTDEAGNIGECNFSVIRDTEPPEPIVSVLTFDHVNLEDPSGFDPNITVDLSARDPAEPTDFDSGSGIRNAELYLINRSGYVGDRPYYYPECDVFDYVINPAELPRIGQSPYGESEFDVSGDFDQAAFETVLESGRGQCFQIVGVFYDNVNNFAIVEPNTGVAGGENRTIAVDLYPGDGHVDACGFFGDFDNCNNRSAFLNGLPVDRFLTTSCPGSCHNGTVSIVGGEIQQARVVLAGFADEGVVPDKYQQTGTTLFPYRFYNITEGNLNERGRDYTIEATPLSPLSIYGTQSVSPVFIEGFLGDPTEEDPDRYPIIDETHVLIGFRDELCTDQCTIQTPTLVGSTCVLQCAGIEGCPSAANDAEGYAVLEECVRQGANANTMITTGDETYLCCTENITDIAGVGTVSTEFEVDATDVARSERVVMLGGRLVRMVVLTFNRE